MYQVTWMDKKGAGQMRTFLALGEVAGFLPKLRERATVRDETGRQVGGVNDEKEFRLMDDRRCRWNWWVEREAKQEKRP